jgi:molybdenum cofactor synthesis domain-containing protein
LDGKLIIVSNLNGYKFQDLTENMDIRMKGFRKRVDVATALRIFFEKAELKMLGCEEILIQDAFERVCAEDIVAEVNLPNFNRSAVDGYAVRAADTFGSSKANPILLRVVGEVEIGKKSSIRVGRGEAARIATGAPMPNGSDAVVMLEYTSKLDDSIEVYRAVTPGDNVSRIGEDVKAGEPILRKGEILQPQDIGMLAALGQLRVKVIKKPRIAILSTGDELVEPGRQEEGKVVDVNRFMLAAAVREMGGEPIDLGISKDDPEELRRMLKKGLESDILLVSGGTSVGERDLVPKIISSLGKIIVHGVAIKPGMPTALAAVGGKPVILLPGFPVAALIAFYTFVPEIIQKMMGVKIIRRKWEILRAKVTSRIPSSPGMRTFARVFVKEGDLIAIAEPLRTSGSGILSSMIKANGLVVIPEEKEGVEEGEEVEVILFRPILRCF